MTSPFDPRDHVNWTYMDRLADADPGLCPVFGCLRQDDHGPLPLWGRRRHQRGDVPRLPRRGRRGDEKGDEARGRAWEREQSGEDVARARLED